MQDRKIRFVKDNSSVLVRLVDASRRGQLPHPAHSVPASQRMVPAYAQSALNSMNKKGGASKTYAAAVPANMTPESFVADLNASAVKLAGLAEPGAGGPGSDSGYGDGSAR